MFGRNIPAHAGETVHRYSVRRLQSEHPRSRGGNCPHDPALSPRDGTSPLTRGKLDPKSRIPRRPPEHPRSRGGNVLHHTAKSNACRNIPAHAGETDVVLTAEFPTNGTSPLTRGKRSDPQAAERLTPEHPRSRGGNPLVNKGELFEPIRFGSGI